MTSHYLEILFTEAVEPDDLEIIEPPQSDQPGLARLNRATVGQARRGAPNSTPLKSQSGATIGFIASFELMSAPFTATYRIVEN